MKVLVSITIFLFACFSYAGTGTGKPFGVMAHEGDVFIFKTQVHDEFPSCNQYGWAISLLTETGRAMFSLVLAAEAQGKSVYVKGKGACVDWHDRETPRYIYIVE